MQSSLPMRNQSVVAERNGYLMVGGLVLLGHLALLYFWLASRESIQMEAGRNIVVAEIFAVHPQTEVVKAAPVPPPVKPVPVAKQAMPTRTIAVRAESTVPTETMTPAQEVVETVPQKAAAPAVTPQPSVLPDMEPDYKAAYLNNPRPPYPPAARRMELQGRVMLNVEVLTDGLCGRIQILKSSGHEMLDNAALQAVKKWRFVPARHAGLAVVKWCQVPIRFNLGESEI